MWIDATSSRSMYSPRRSCRTCSVQIAPSGRPPPGGRFGGSALSGSCRSRVASSITMPATAHRSPPRFQPPSAHHAREGRGHGTLLAQPPPARPPPTATTNLLVCYAHVQLARHYSVRLQTNVSVRLTSPLPHQRCM